MKYIQKNIRQTYIQALSELFKACTPETLARLKAIVDPSAEALAETFYAAMLNNVDASKFLNHALVHSRLAGSMARWLRELFICRDAESLPGFVDLQLHVGEVHARIDLPPYILNLGFRVLKRALEELIVDTFSDDQEFAIEALSKMHQMVDIASAAMNESYFGDIMSNERKSQVLQTQIVGQDLMVVMERLRADLFDWQRRIVTLVHRSKVPDLSHLPSASHSDFGMWIIHKAGLFFSGLPEVEQLEIHLHQLDDFPARMHSSRKNGEPIAMLDKHLEELDSVVTRISWLLSSLASHHTESEAGRDTLTRLFNRRFLDPILQRETRHSMRSGSPYGVLLIDLDHFKRVNDTYGHEAGDKVLQQCAELLQSNVRAGDFVFRHGGEEFLIVMAEVSQKQVEQVAEKLVKCCRETDFNIKLESPIKVTLSIGVAIHDGHPDYMLLLERADRALYEAKNTGRDRVCYS